MIDLKQLRDDPDRFALGARQKGVEVDIPRVLALDERRRSLVQQQEGLRAEQRTIEKAMGPEIGKLMGRLKGAQDDEKGALERELAELKNRPIAAPIKPPVTSPATIRGILINTAMIWRMKRILVLARAMATG